MSEKPSSTSGTEYSQPVAAPPTEPTKAAKPAAAKAGAKPAAVAKSVNKSAAGEEWDPSQPQPAAAQSAPSQAETALKKSGVTSAMIEARKAFQQLTREALVTPFAASGATHLGPLNIIGTAFGQKWSDGRPTGKRGVLVLVRSKAREEQVSSQSLAPPSELIKGERVVFDVVEVGEAFPLGYQTSETPAPFGASIGLGGRTTGTLGCRVYWNGEGGKKCILSNNHVLADVNKASIGDEIVQPGTADGFGGRRVGLLADFVPLSLSPSAQFPSAPNRVDAALAWAVKDQVAMRFHNDFPFDPEPIDFYEGMRVIKEGRTTGYTEGTINGIGLDLNLPYGSNFGLPAPPYGYFVDQIQIRADWGQPFSKPGDSGSLVCGLADDGMYHPIGLLFAGNGSTFTWANPIREVFDALDIGYIQYEPAS